jgi:tripeptidyl-peptidase-1
MVTLANSARLDAGKTPLGFLNPALYSFPSSVFHDITVGENNCAAAHSDPVCCKYGFTAAAGWDPLTGLGSPVFPKFLAAALALP